MKGRLGEDGEKSYLIVKYLSFFNLRAGFLCGVGSGNSENR